MLVFRHYEAVNVPRPIPCRTAAIDSEVSTRFFPAPTKMSSFFVKKQLYQIERYRNKGIQLLLLKSQVLDRCRFGDGQRILVLPKTKSETKPSLFNEAIEKPFVF